ncbi:MAG: 50S ribosomal protein L11 methyltransferase [Verrucomicrobia bacterium]|nr:50S ribosomal protein L11 methyltransferase [Verrucomicrobiota bacterium]
MRAWRKTTSQGRVGYWAQRLEAFGSERLAITETGRSARLEIFDVTEAEAGALRGQFGGEIRDLAASNADWARSVVQHRPISIRGRLLVYNTEPAPEAGTKRTDGKALLIPAGTAFGTGDHATTATCLRLLCDRTATLPVGSWSFLDIGCGTGILALAAARFGARPAEGFDLDAAAVRVARANARLNRLFRARFFRADLFKFTPLQPYDVVAANVYSEVLVQAARKVWATVKPGGTLIVSGILRTQTREVQAAFGRLGACLQTTRLRGKWATLEFR